MQIFLPANTLLVKFLAKVHPVQRGTSAAGWRGSRCAHPHVQGTAPAGKNHHSNHLRKPRNWYRGRPRNPSGTASVLHKREQIPTGLQRGSSVPLQGTGEDLGL